MCEEMAECKLNIELMMRNSDSRNSKLGDEITYYCKHDYVFEDGVPSHTTHCQLVVDDEGNIYPQWQDVGDCKRKFIS